MSLPTLNLADLDTILQTSRKIALKFTAPWCGPCRAYAPIVDTVAEAFPDVDFFEIDIDKEPELATRWGVRAIPLIIGISEGQTVFRLPGLNSESMLKKQLALL